MTTKEIYEELFHKKDRTFLTTEHGLTSTEANHKTNLIAEKLKEVTAQFYSTGAYTATMNFEGQDIRMDKNAKISNLAELALAEGDMYALTSWYKEGIKAKESLLNWLRITSVDKLMLKGKEYPKFEEKHPVTEYVAPAVSITENDVLGTFSIAERSEYLALTSKAAHLGMKIHKGGVINKIRKSLQQGILTSFEEKPNGGGMKTYVVTHNALYNITDIDKIFFALQKQHLSYEAKLNHYKARIADEINTRNSESLQVFNNAYKAAQEANRVLLVDYNQKYQSYITEISTINTDLEKRRLELNRYIATLKIITPNELKTVLDYLEPEKK